MKDRFEIEKMDNISINDKNTPLEIYHDSIIYIKEEIKNFDPRTLEIVFSKNVLFKIYLSKSYDGINWSELKTQEELIIEFEEMLKNENDYSQSQLIEKNLIGEKIFLSIWCKQYKEVDDVKDIPETIYQKKNIDERIPQLFIETINYLEHSEPPFKPDPILEITPKNIISEPEGKTETLKIVSNLYWNVIISDDWITLDKNTGKGNDELVLIISENTEKIERYGSLLFSSPDYDKEIEIPILQNRADSEAFIELSDTIKNVSNELQSFSFNILSNTNWNIRFDVDWVKLSPKTGNNNSEILCVIDKNLTTQKRVATIFIETLDKKITKTFVVNQTEYVFIPYSGGGKGTKVNPYKLGIPEDLNYMITTDGHDSGDNQKVYFELYQDIDMTGYYYTVNTTITFSGVFDGKNHTIRNFSGERGLFENTSNAIIMNLKLHVNIHNTTRNKSFGLCSRASTSVINNIFVEGDIYWEQMEVGSICGELQNSSLLNSYASVNLKTNGNQFRICGGLVGLMNNTENVVVGCYFNGTFINEGLAMQKYDGIVGNINGLEKNYFKNNFFLDTFETKNPTIHDGFKIINKQELNTKTIVDLLNEIPEEIINKKLIIYGNPFIIGDTHPKLRELTIDDIVLDNTGRILNPNHFLSTMDLIMDEDEDIDPRFQVIPHSYDLSSDSKDIRIQTIYQLINQFPKWNFYDNQQITIKRWLEQCNSLAESYGHTCVYFKTTPIEVSHTLSTNVVRNVTSIKKLHIMFPNNELPQDRNTFTDWDLALQDDFICHIVVDKFEQAFGKNQIPEQRDYLYLPIINKIFRVTSMQPKNGFMGKIGWWEVFLAKYEEDECVVIEDDLKRAMSGFPDINEAMDTVEQNIENLKLQNKEELKPLLDEIEIFKTSTVRTSDVIDKLSIDEKKKATQNFTDKLNDSTTFISMKESDAMKEFLSKRLNIVSVNPDKNIYPVTMYNCTEVSKRTVALTYNISDFTKVNKKSNIVNTCFDLNFNFVLFQRFTGEIFDLLSKGNTFLTIENNRKKISIILHNYQKTLDVNFVFNEKEFYQICLNFKKEIKPSEGDIHYHQLAIKIFSIADKQKNLEYQNTYIIELNNDTTFDIDKIYLYGGQFFTNDIELNIENKNIIMDNANPVVQMNKFSL